MRIDTSGDSEIQHWKVSLTQVNDEFSEVIERSEIRTEVRGNVITI